MKFFIFSYPSYTDIDDMKINKFTFEFTDSNNKFFEFLRYC